MRIYCLLAKSVASFDRVFVKVTEALSKQYGFTNISSSAAIPVAMKKLNGPQF